MLGANCVVKKLERSCGPTKIYQASVVSNSVMADFFGAMISGTGKRWKTASKSPHSPDIVTDPTGAFTLA